MSSSVTESYLHLIDLRLGAQEDVQQLAAPLIMSVTRESGLVPPAELGVLVFPRLDEFLILNAHSLKNVMNM